MANNIDAFILLNLVFLTSWSSRPAFLKPELKIKRKRRTRRQQMQRQLPRKLRAKVDNGKTALDLERILNVPTLAPSIAGKVFATFIHSNK
jgi:hypothetical protein